MEGIDGGLTTSRRRGRGRGSRKNILVALLAVMMCMAGRASSLKIVRPAPHEGVLLWDDGMEIEVDLGRHTVPSLGFLVVHLDGIEAAVYCPDLVPSLAHCPSSPRGGELRGKSVRLQVRGGPMKAGERSLTVELVDAAMGILEEASTAFTAVGMHDVDGDLPREGPAFNAVIFSKDRACQLDQLLASINAHVPNMDARGGLKLQVLYTSSSPSFEKGYEELKALHPHVHFHREGNVSAGAASPSQARHGGTAKGGFEAEYLSLLDPAIPYTLHFVDDMVMVRDWGVIQQLHAHRVLSTRQDVVAHSLRSDSPPSPPLIASFLTLRGATPLPPQGAHL